MKMWVGRRLVNRMKGVPLLAFTKETSAANKMMEFPKFLSVNVTPRGRKNEL